MKSLGFIIILGTALGVLLEYTGCTRIMASAILKITGIHKAPLALNITGFIVGLPVFCDSGFIVLSGLSNSISKKTGISVVLTSIALAVGLYAVHCLIPPHPGITTAAIGLGTDLGKLILYGIPVAIGASAAGYLWTMASGKKLAVQPIEQQPDQEIYKGRSVIMAFLPVVIPIILIAGKSFISIDHSSSSIIRAVFSLGDPVIALTVGVLLALVSKRKWKRIEINSIFTDAIEKAGGILIIIGAGGAFGNVLSASGIGKEAGILLPITSAVLLFPYLLTIILKTAQGSSTVAIITASTIIQPLFLNTTLNNEREKLFIVLAMGAGSMMISHANDAYFWVISKFSGIDAKTMFRIYSMATIIMSLTSLGIIYLMSLIF
jgi:gluconate:H+ symporter, GntP family